MKIKPKKVALPYSLKEVSEFFNYPVKRLELHLRSLSEQEEIHHHDTKKVGNDFQLSQFAVSVLVFEINETVETIHKLADFIENGPTKQPKRYAHTSLLYQHKLLSLKLETRNIDDERKEISEFLANHEKMLDELIHSANPCSAANN